MMDNNSSSQKNLNVRLSAMHLNWNIPSGDKFAQWLKEVKTAGYDGITSFAHWGLEPYIDKPDILKSMLDEYGLSLAAVDVKLHDQYDSYKPIFEFMQKLGCNLAACIDPADESRCCLIYCRFFTVCVPARSSLP